MECTQTTTTRRELRLAEKRVRRRRFRPRRPNSATAMMVSVGLTAALLGAGASQAYSDHQVRSAQDAVADAVAHERANRVRSDRADGARLEGVAIAFATVRRSEAVVLARAAVAQATSTRASSAPDVTPETLTPLDEAMVNLAALIEAAPPAPVPTPLAALDAAATAVPAAASAVSNDLAPSKAADGEAASAGATDADAGATAVSLAAVDLDVSAQLLLAAQRVNELSVQVEAVADANVAAAAQAAAEAAAVAAAAEAARVAEAAAQAAAAELTRKVAAVEDAPNGAVSTELLCGVAFDSAVLLRCDAAQALDQLAVAYRDDFGRYPSLVSSYRSLADQVSVRRVRGGLAALPGSSNHGRGLAIDLADFGSLGQFSTPGYRWMKEHAREFGWHHPAIMEPGGGGPQEPWHWEFETD